MLLNKTAEHTQLAKFPYFSGKKSEAQLVNTLSFPGSSPNIKETLFFLEHLQGDCLINLL